MQFPWTNKFVIVRFRMYTIYTKVIQIMIFMTCLDENHKSFGKLKVCILQRFTPNCEYLHNFMKSDTNKSNLFRYRDQILHS